MHADRKILLEVDDNGAMIIGNPWRVLGLWPIHLLIKIIFLFVNYYMIEQVWYKSKAHKHYNYL